MKKFFMVCLSVVGFGLFGGLSVNAEEGVYELARLCINDNKDHGDDIEGFAKKHFKGDVVRTDIYTQGIFEEDVHEEVYKDCDVINYSFGTTPQYIKDGGKMEDNIEQFEKTMKWDHWAVNNFIKVYKGIIVSSAGNRDGGDTILSSPIARYKTMNERLNYDKAKDEERLFVVGQVEPNGLGGYIHHFSEGDKIDFVLPNYNAEMGGQTHIGTSTASGEVSGVIAQVLEIGVPQEEVRNILAYEKKDHVWNDKSYKVLSIKKTLQNANNYAKVNNIARVSNK